MRYLKKTAGIFLPVFVLVLSVQNIQAGDINEAEQSIISYYNKTYYYEGKTYVATESAKAEAYAYLIRDDVNLTEAEARSAISQANQSIAEGIAQGKLIEVKEEGNEHSDTETGDGETDKNDSDDTENNVNGDNSEKDDTAGKDDSAEKGDATGNDDGATDNNGSGDNKNENGNQTNNNESKTEKDKTNSLSDKSNNKKTTRASEGWNSVVTFLFGDRFQGDDAEHAATETQQTEMSQAGAKNKDASHSDGTNVKKKQETGGTANTSAKAKRGHWPEVLLGIVAVVLATIFVKKKHEKKRIRPAGIFTPDAAGYLDFHSHIVPEVDDGAKSWDMTRQMLEMAYEQGIKTIVATSHFYPGKSHLPSEAYRQRVARVDALAKELHEDMQVLAGNEIFYSEGILREIKEGKALPMADSKYVLLEFAPRASKGTVERGIRDLLSIGYVPVVAHMERVECLRNDMGFVKQCIGMGAYMQVNTRTLMGRDGKKAAQWIRNGYVHFLGSDCHNTTDRPPVYQDAVNYLAKQADRECLQRILVENAKTFLNKKFIRR